MANSNEQISDRTQMRDERLSRGASAAAWLLGAGALALYGVYELSRVMQSTLIEAVNGRTDTAHSPFIGASALALSVLFGFASANQSRKAAALDYALASDALNQAYVSMRDVRAVGVASVPNQISQTAVVQSAPTRFTEYRISRPQAESVSQNS